MEKQKQKLDEFREYVKRNDENKIDHDGMEEGEFENSFLISCKKCGSSKIEFFGESGCDYGGYTGYSPGENGFKCLECGNAITWWF